MKQTAALLLLLFATTGCATRMVVGGLVAREIVITGTCIDGSGAPKSGVRATAMESHGSWVMLFGPFAGPQLPEHRPVTNVLSDDAGKFVLRVRSTRELVLELRDSSDTRVLAGRAKLWLPEERNDLSVSVLMKDGVVSAHWEK